MMFFAVLKYQTKEQGFFEAIVRGNSHKDILEEIEKYTKVDRVMVSVYKTNKLFEMNETTTEERICL